MIKRKKLVQNFSPLLPKPKNNAAITIRTYMTACHTESPLTLDRCYGATNKAAIVMSMDVYKNKRRQFVSSVEKGFVRTALCVFPLLPHSVRTSCSLL